MRHHSSSAAMAILLGLVAGPAMAGRDCRTIDVDISSAIRLLDIDAVAVLGKEALSEESCSSDYKNKLRFDLANAHVKAAYALAGRGEPLDKQIAALEAGRAFSLTAPLLATLAEAYTEAKRYDDAAAAAQAAINAFTDEATARDEKNSEELARLSRIALQAGQLSRAFVPPPVQTDGDFGGLFNAALARSFGVEEIPLPIEFPYNETAFTQKGRDAAAFLLAFLAKRPDLKRLKLIGHTDDKGSDAFNLKLSQERSKAVANYLKENGLSDREIETVGKGESEPAQINNATTLSVEEIDQVNRRVVLVLE